MADRSRPHPRRFALEALDRLRYVRDRLDAALTGMVVASPEEIDSLARLLTTAADYERFDREQTR